MIISKLKNTVKILTLGLFLAALAFWGNLAYLANRNQSACLPISQSASSQTNSVLESKFQSVLDQYSESHNQVGLQSTIVFPDGGIWNGVSGLAQHNKQCVMTLDHQLYIGSITKTFTAALVMQQIQIGTLQLNDTIDQWLSHPHGNEITIQMLLQHRSGVPNYTEDFSFLLAYFGYPDKQWQPEELFAVIQEKPLKFEPGSQHLYSNTNFIALGMILEKTTGKAYSELLQNAIAEMGLTHIYYPGFSGNLAFANGYDETIFNLGKRNLTAFRTSFVSGAFSAGGVSGSSQDIAFFFHTLFNNQWLSDEIVAQMMSTISAPDEDVPLQKGYGLGVRNLVIDGEELYGHTGTIPGYSGIAMHNPQYEFTIVVLSNVSTIEQTIIFSELQNLLIQNLHK